MSLSIGGDIADNGTLRLADLGGNDTATVAVRVPENEVALALLEAAGPLAVTSALFDDAGAAETAYRTVKPLAERAGATPPPHSPLWLDAARHGLADPELHEAAAACFAAALDALPRLGADSHVLSVVAAHTERYVARGRCPADDLLDAAPPDGTGAHADGTHGAGARTDGTPLFGKDAHR